MSDPHADQRITLTSGCRRSKLARLAAVRFRWTEAVDWAREQDERRSAEQLRFAESRALVHLERIWALPASEPFRRS